MANVKLKNKAGNYVVYENVNEITLPGATGGNVTFGDISGKPTLSSPTLNNGTTSNPLFSNTNAENGKFVQRIVYTINDVDVEENIQITSAVATLPWIYSITPLAGGTFTAYAKVQCDGLNDSNQTSRSVTMISGTQTNGYCSVAGLGNSDPSTLTYTYDPNFPRTFQEVTDAYGNVFIEIPTIYRKILATSDGQITSYALSLTARDSDYKPYPCFLDHTNNNAVLPYVRIGKYCMSNTTVARSINATPVEMNIGAGRTLARNRGKGYQLFDWQMWELFRDLGLLQSRYVNINIGRYIYVIMGIAHQQHYIWVDGITRGSSDDGTQWYCCYNPDNYANAGGGTSTSTSASEADILTLGYEKVGYTSPSAGGYITKLGYDSNHPFFNQPSAASGGGSSSYYCDNFYISSGARPVSCNVGRADTGYGWWYCDAGSSWGSSGMVRLCYKPVAN